MIVFIVLIILALIVKAWPLLAVVGMAELEGAGVVESVKGGEFP